MNTPKIATRAEWLEARVKLLVREKDLNRQRDDLTEQRRQLPWVRIEKRYRFEGRESELTLRDLFDGRTQLLVYHFMFGPDWAEGCPSCSFWADSFEGTQVHLAHRDVTFVCASRAPYAKLAAYQARMGWTFPWYSSAPSDFNADFGVSFTPEQQERGRDYNFRHADHPPEEAPGSARSRPMTRATSSTPTRPTHEASTRSTPPTSSSTALPADAMRTGSPGPWNGFDATTPTTDPTNDQRRPSDARARPIRRSSGPAATGVPLRCGGGLPV